MKQVRINVLIVTYKQADVIGRNIESIIKQKNYGLNKIVICDDCSPDNNWDIIQSYINKYPEYIEAYHNETNLGIYGNSNKLMSLCGDADLYCWLEGDDALCDGFFEEVQMFITSNQIDTNRAIGILSDYKIIWPSGKSVVIKNDFCNKHQHILPFRCYLHGKVSWRSGLFTKPVLEMFDPVDINKGLALAETQFDSQWFKNIKESFYLPYVGSIYYSGIGISQELTQDSSYKKEEALVQWKYYMGLRKWNFIDRSWIKANILRAQFFCTPSLNLIGKFAVFSAIGSIGFDFSIKKILISIREMFRVMKG